MSFFLANSVQFVVVLWAAQLHQGNLLNLPDVSLINAVSTCSVSFGGHLSPGRFYFNGFIFPFPNTVLDLMEFVGRLGFEVFYYSPT